MHEDSGGEHNRNEVLAEYDGGKCCDHNGDHQSRANAIEGTKHEGKTTSLGSPTSLGSSHPIIDVQPQDTAETLGSGRRRIH